MKNVYGLWTFLVCLFVVQAPLVFSAPDNLRSVSFSIKSTTDTNDVWWLDPDSNLPAKDHMLICAPIESSASGAYILPKGKTLRFILKQVSLGELGHKPATYQLSFTWNDLLQEYQLNEHYLVSSSNNRQYEIRSFFLPTEYENPADADSKVVSADLALNVQELSVLPSFSSGLTLHDPKVTEETDGLGFNSALFRVVLVNHPDDVQKHRKWFTLRSLRMWPDYIDEKTLSISASSRVSKRKLLSGVSSSQETLPLSSLGLSDDVDLINPSVSFAAKIEGQTNLMGALAGGNQLSLVIEKIKREGQGGLRRETAESYDYIKLNIRGKTLTVLDGNANRWIKNYVYIREYDNGKPVLTLVLQMKKLDELSGEDVDNVDKALLQIGQTVHPDTQDASDESDGVTLFPKTREEFTSYMEKMRAWF